MIACRSVAALAVAFVLFDNVAANAQQNSAPSAATVNGVSAATQNGQASPPRCDANCVRENAARAADACAPRIEAQAPTDFDWITRPNPGIFQQADPSSPSDSIVRYRGDSVRFMAADKTWIRVSYECGYDVSKQAVSYAQVRSGRLDQPLTSAAAPNNATVQNTPAPPLNRTAPLPTPPTTVQAAAVPAPGSALQAAAAHPKPRVGEPSSVVIQQQSPNPSKPH